MKYFLILLWVVAFGLNSEIAGALALLFTFGYWLIKFIGKYAEYLM